MARAIQRGSIGAKTGSMGLGLDGGAAAEDDGGRKARNEVMVTSAGLRFPPAPETEGRGEMRSTEEIAAWYEQERDADFLGFTGEVVLVYLSADELKPFVKPDADLSDWIAEPLSEESVLEAMRGYMQFAWDKALSHRGISAGRSVEKMRAWLWILGDDEMVAFADDDANYAQYGAPVLKAISEKYGFPIPNGEAVERMAQGLPCCSSCQDGCGQ